MPVLVWADEGLPIHLKVFNGTEKILDNTFLVTECAGDASSTPTVSGYCALQQSGLSVTWSPYGDDQFLDSINAVANDYANNYYWSWFADLNYGQTALNKHELHEGEELLVTIKSWPLKIAVATTSPYVQSTTTISVLHFGFDEAWNGVWLPTASSSVMVGENKYETNELGQVELFVNDENSLAVFAQADGFIESSVVTLNPHKQGSEDTNPTSGGGGSGGANPIHNFDVAKAVAYISSKQQTDGSFGSGLYTDWSIIGLVASGNTSALAAARDYEKNNPLGSGSVTDYERRAMAMMALGLNPYTDTSVNYIQKIVDQFDGGQVGDSGLVTDDVFAVFPLMRAGYASDDSLIQSVVKNIIAHQEANGSWNNSPDVTGAALQVLGAVSTDGSSAALEKAKAYLHSVQQPDGGFGTSYSTSWVWQALSSAGESESNWRSGERSPEAQLATLQQVDGGVEPVTTDESSRLWATAYALPAITHHSWLSLLNSFSKPVIVTTQPTPTPSPEPQQQATTTQLAIGTTTQPVFDTVVPEKITTQPRQIDVVPSPILPETKPQVQQVAAVAITPFNGLPYVGGIIIILISVYIIIRTKI